MHRSASAHTQVVLFAPNNWQRGFVSSPFCHVGSCVHVDLDTGGCWLDIVLMEDGKVLDEPLFVLLYLLKVFVSLYLCYVQLKLI